MHCGSIVSPGVTAVRYGQLTGTGLDCSPGCGKARASQRVASNRALNYPPELILFKATRAFCATEAGNGR